MDTTYRSAYVYVRDAFAGTLKETDSGYSFLYGEEYLALCRESYLPEDMKPAFEELICNRIEKLL